MNGNQHRPGFELGLQCPFPTTITVTPIAPPLLMYKWFRSLLQLTQSLFQAFEDHLKSINYNCVTVTLFHVPLLFSSLANSRYLCISTVSFIFTLLSTETAEPNRQVIFSLLIHTWPLKYILVYAKSCCILDNLVSLYDLIFFLISLKSMEQPVSSDL